MSDDDTCVCGHGWRYHTLASPGLRTTCGVCCPCMDREPPPGSAWNAYNAFRVLCGKPARYVDGAWQYPDGAGPQLKHYGQAESALLVALDELDPCGQVDRAARGEARLTPPPA